MKLQTLTKPTFWAPLAVVMIVCYFFIDLPLTKFLYQVDQQHHWLTLVFNQINRLGQTTYYLVGIGLAWLWAFFIAKNKRIVWICTYILLALICSGVAVDSFKIICGRARPYEFFSHNLYGFYFFQWHDTFWSFPSGHACIISTVATSGYLLVRRFGWVFITAILLVCFGRLMCRAHYLSDVMMGAYLGFIITLWLYGRFANKIASKPDVQLPQSGTTL